MFKSLHLVLQVSTPRTFKKKKSQSSKGTLDLGYQRKLSLHFSMASSRQVSNGQEPESHRHCLMRQDRPPWVHLWPQTRLVWKGQRASLPGCGSPAWPRVARAEHGASQPTTVLQCLLRRPWGRMLSARFTEHGVVRRTRLIQTHVARWMGLTSLS